MLYNSYGKLELGREYTNMKEHIMNLNSSPMKEIREGRKTIELRLYDEKRKKISVGDIIIFVNTENADDTLFVTVKNLFVYRSFAELYDDLPLLKCGYTAKNIDTASPDDMELYYSKEKQSQYGVVGIEIELM